ncbi:Hsp70 family protein [Umezakia ovalisporum]|uniref:Hsp70 family protein n=1 Tax=Umezakia ovalisporum FSS-43 TaxID=2740520 RepID=A0ABT6JZ30_9CYAN|nr:Hsp70 family protein [Umezakia ovalisporum]MDH6055379.1 Hsp70 family protein [Umezakia ovalisporum FSS-43]MDH6068026.1 Hsp70 family protein [Umezakia ovalisporum APH033B]MDH6069949.1 Hsp70 family protein [Umezakia ovalisporum CobakiLakeA]MDH6073004.1 Hsp70 family protein [Umezakia ovalisporum CS-1034]MDH6083224.1 Hsp70 family protein [Umezakia ovalisporum FSS-44]
MAIAQNLVPKAMAIDFGTSNTVIACWNPSTQQTETLTIPGLSTQTQPNPPLVPSLVYIEEATQGLFLIGQEVRDRGLDLEDEKRFFRNFKRGIGAEIQGFLPEIDGEVFTFERVGEVFLNKIITQLALRQKNLDCLILTVPVDSFEAYRLWLSKICQILPVDKIQILDEPTAAALGYGLADKEILLVVDFGGGTLDLSLVRLHQNVQAKKPLGFTLKWGNKSLAEEARQKPKTACVLAKAGQNLGGSDIDAWLADYFAKTQDIAVTPLITRLAERIKIQLSTQNQGAEVYFDDENFRTYQLELNCEIFDNILNERGFFACLDECMTSLLQQGRRRGVDVADINAVLLVGGTAQLPGVQRWIKGYFEPEKIHCTNPFEAIAQGALQLAQGMEVNDFLYHSYGIRYWDYRNGRHGWHSIIKAGQVYPMSDSVELLLGASSQNQPSIELIVGELSTSASTEVYFDENNLVTRSVHSGVTRVKPLNDNLGGRIIARLNPLGYPGSDRVRVSFHVDKERFLRISVEDLLTNEILLENQLVAQLG